MDSSDSLERMELEDDMDESSDSCSPFSTSECSSTTPTSIDDWEGSEASLPSPAPSVYSVTDSIIAQSFTDEYGRKLNSYSNVYRLPADEEEITRLRNQHYFFTEVMGRYPPGLQELLAEEPDVDKAVLDLGCGCGTWIMDLARDFPHVRAVGIDLIPVQAADMPFNCRSEIDDINLGLEHFYGEFDVVHARLISSGIQDYAALVEQVAHVVRPNGLVSFSEWDFRVYDGRKKILLGDETDPISCHLARFCAFVNRAARARGGSVDAANLLDRWCLDNNAFIPDSVHHADYWLPASPWPSSEGPDGERLRSWGAAMRENGLIFIHGARPLLLGHGLPPEQVDELLHNAQRELLDARIQLWTRCQRVTARKRP